VCIKGGKRAGLLILTSSFSLYISLRERSSLFSLEAWPETAFFSGRIEVSGAVGGERLRLHRRAGKEKKLFFFAVSSYILSLFSLSSKLV